MSLTTGNYISGAGGYGAGVVRRPYHGPPLGPLVVSIGVAGLVLLTPAGKLARVGLTTLGVARGLALRGLNVATKPVFWAGVNAYQEAEDAAAWLRGEDMSWQLAGKIRPIRHPVFGSWAPGVPAIPVPFPYLDFAKTPSSGGGGPGEIPNLHQPPPSIEETGEILSNPPIAGEVPSSPKRSAHRIGKSGWLTFEPRCRVRKGRRQCVQVEGHRGRHKFTKG
jgi:hypothetical protein